MSKEQDLPLSVVLDVDEVLVNSVKRHTSVLAYAAQRYGWSVVATYDELCQAGGTHNVYGDFPEYDQLNKQMRASPEFNNSLEAMPGSVEAANLFASILLFYLTTRPNNLTNLTQRHLKELGFPQREVVARPTDIHFSRTSQWKFSVLQQRSRELNQRLLLIDDNLFTHRLILEKDDPQVKTLLYLGPITPLDVKFNALDWAAIVKEINRKADTNFCYPLNSFLDDQVEV